MAHHLVVDASGFMKAVDLRSLFSECMYTVVEVVDEIRDKATRERLKVLPFDLLFKRPSAKALHTVTEVAKMTGDFASLSSTDLKLLALTYDLEVEHVGSNHLVLQPHAKTSVHFHGNNKSHKKERSKDKNKNKLETEVPENTKSDDGLRGKSIEGGDQDSEEYNSFHYWRQPIPDVDLDDQDDEVTVSDKIDPEFPGEDEGVVLQADDEDNDDENDDNDDDDDSDGEWITPSNLKQKQLEYMGIDGKRNDLNQSVAVACLTTDFAMQNVMKQMNLNVLSLNGMVVRHTRTWQLRCTACFRLTKADSLNKFCPWCGNKTLRRVAVTLNEDGSRDVHINVKKPLNSRGKKFSLPKPQGGKHALNPKLSADQRGPDQRASKKALQKTNALHSDYIAGESPFALRDVTSKSSMLGVPGVGQMATAAYWDRSNPNAARRPTGNRRRKRNT